MLTLTVKNDKLALYSKDGVALARVDRPMCGNWYVLTRVGTDERLRVRRFAWSTPEGLDKAMRAAMRKAGWLEEGE